MKTVIAPVVKVTRWRSMSSSATSASKRWKSTSGRAGQQRQPDVRDEPGDVEERRDAEDHVVAAHADPVAVGLRAEDDVAVGVHRALGRPRRARRVGQERDVVGRQAGIRRRLAGVGARELAHLARRDDVRTEVPATAAHATSRPQRLERHERHRLAVLEQRAHLALLEHRVDRHRDGARASTPPAPRSRTPGRSAGRGRRDRRARRRAARARRRRRRRARRARAWVSAASR